MPLRRSAEFDAVYRQGRKVEQGLLYLYIYERGDEGPARIGFSVGKHFGGAVARNRLKRLLREAWRKRQPVRGGRDFVVAPRRSAKGKSLREIEAALENLLRKLEARGSVQ